MRKSKKYIRLNQLPKRPKALSELISLVSSNVSNAKIKRFIRDRYNHKLIYDSSIGLLRKKIRVAFTDNISITDLLRGKGNHNIIPLKHVEPMDFVHQEIDRLSRKSATGTLTNSDKRYAIQILKCEMHSNYLWD